MTAMAEAIGVNEQNEILKPFYQRASEVEERLSRLEAAVTTTKKDAGNDEATKTVSELQLKLEEAKAEQASERKEASLEIQKLTKEKEKLEYRILHLLRALEEADGKVES